MYANAPLELQAAGLVVSAMVSRDAMRREPSTDIVDHLAVLVLAAGALSLAIEDVEAWHRISARVLAASVE